LDDGSEFFDPSNLEFTSIHSPNDGENVIPNYAQAKFNIRFNDKQNSQDLIKWVEYICSKSVYKQDYELDSKVSGESFLCKPKSLSQISKKVILDTLKVNASLSTSGGTSDARFIKDYCDNIIELGLLNKTAHQINEHAKLQDITSLKEIYKKIILDYGNI
jgi:succinyl-diaminopimelate desuccinylase